MKIEMKVFNDDGEMVYNGWTDSFEVAEMVLDKIDRYLIVEEAV